MKRLLTILLTLALTLSLCACGKLESIVLPPLPSATPEAMPMPEATEAPELPADDNPTIVRIENTVKKAYDPQNASKLILTFAYDSAKVQMDKKPEVANAINEYLAKLDETFYTGEDYGDGYGTGYNNMLTTAEDNYNYWASQDVENPPIELSNTRVISVARLDSSVLTLVYSDSIYLGGAHDSYIGRSYSFDLETGEKLSIDKLSPDSEGFKQHLVNCMLQKMQEDDSYLERMDGFVPNDDYASAFRSLLRDGSWLLDREGIEITSDQYEYSSYAAGTIGFSIPYENLSPYIDTKYLPKPVASNGSIALISADDMKNKDFELFDNLTVENGSEQLYLVAKGDVSNVSITSMNYIEQFDCYYMSRELRRYSTLDDTAVLLSIPEPDANYTLALRYTTSEGEQVYYIIKSEQDGSITLIPEADASPSIFM